jgi:hypothetical protein
MFHDRIKFLMFVSGIATATAGVLLYFALPMEPGYQLSLERVLKSLSLEEIIGPPGPSDWGTIKAEFDLIIDSPPEIQTGDAFVLVLTATLKQVTFVPRTSSRTHRDIGEAPGLALDPMLAGPAIPLSQFSSEQLRDTIHQRMKRGEIAFLLSLAGAKVEPTGKNPVSENGRTQWSVKPEGPGLLRGFVKPDFPQSSGDHSGKYQVEYSVADYIPVNITSTEPIVTTKSVLLAVTFFGSTFLTFPGILAFLKERRKKRQEREAEQQRRRSKIILPNDRGSGDKSET